MLNTGANSLTTFDRGWHDLGLENYDSSQFEKDQYNNVDNITWEAFLGGMGNKTADGRNYFDRYYPGLDRGTNKIITGQSDGTPVNGSQSGNPGYDYTSPNKSDDITGYDQSYWALIQQWKMDEAERQFNSAEAQKQRDWEKMMSDTAISRSVADIKNAGLNPWLALNGGSLGAASTPSGASASSSSGSSKVPTNYSFKLISSLVSSASGLLGSIAKWFSGK